MNENYNQSYTRDEIAEYLNTVRGCVENGNFTILQGRTRQKNVHFIRQYNIRYEMQKNIIKNLRVEDFCYSLVSTNVQHLGSLLYVFAPQVDLFNIDSDVENVSIYIKIEICETSTGRRTVAVSFHEIERPIEYAFR